MLDPSAFTRPDFGRYSESNYSAPPPSNYGGGYASGNVGVADGGEFTPSANFANLSPLYEPHPNPYANFDHGSPRLEETQRRSALLGNGQSGMRNEYSEEDGDGLSELAQQRSRVRTPPAVHEFRRQSRLDMSALRSGSDGSVSVNSERIRERERRNGEHRRQFSGADREELILVEEVAGMRNSGETDEEKRVRREKRRAAKAAAGRTVHGNTHRERKARDVKYRGCFSNKNRGVRTKSIMCFVSGGLLLTMVSTYLGLALSDNELTSAGHVILILLISFFTLLFCHYLLCVARYAFAAHPSTTAKSAANRRAKQAAERAAERARKQPNHIYDVESATRDGVWQNQAAQQSWDGTTNVNTDNNNRMLEGYYAPTEVRYTRSNAEAVLRSPDGSPRIAPPPPAYGLWRESVRVNPERVFYNHGPMPPMPAVPHEVVQTRSAATTWPAAPAPAVAPAPVPTSRLSRRERRQMDAQELALAMLEGRVRGEQEVDFGRGGGERRGATGARPPSYESEVSALSDGERGDVREERMEREGGSGGRLFFGEEVHPGLRR